MQNAKIIKSFSPRKGILEFYVLTDYPLNNMNSDEFGRPKSAIMGDSLRVYFSAQCKKRAMRTNELFKELVGEIATRTRRVPNIVYSRLIEEGMDKKVAAAAAVTVAGKAKGKTKKSDPFVEQCAKLENDERIGDMSFMSKREVDDIIEACIDIFKTEYKGDAEKFIDDFAHNNKKPIGKIGEWCRKKGKTDPHPMTADQALFGRMVTDSYPGNINAALKVAPSIQIHASSINNDYITAVEELIDDDPNVNGGSGHITGALFTSGIYLTYMCLDLDQLYENCDGAENREELYCTIAGSLPLLIAFSNPQGRQSNFLSQAIPDFLAVSHKVHKHAATPAGAFRNPDSDFDMAHAIKALTDRCMEIFNVSAYTKPNGLACVCLEKNAVIPEDFARVETIDSLCDTIKDWISA